MQAMGHSPEANAAVILRFTMTSVSPNSARRSECPTITYSTPASRSIGPLTSPVNAPSRSQNRSCAPMPMLLFRAASTAGMQREERRREHDLHAVEILGDRAELLDVLHGLVDRLVHLPVGADEGNAHVGSGPAHQVRLKPDTTYKVKDY